MREHFHRNMGRGMRWRKYPLVFKDGNSVNESARDTGCYKVTFLKGNSRQFSNFTALSFGRVKTVWVRSSCHFYIEGLSEMTVCLSLSLSLPPPSAPSQLLHLITEDFSKFIVLLE